MTKHPPLIQTAPTKGLVRELNLRDGMALVVGTVIGSGIFLVPGAVARQLPSFSGVLLVWVVGGALSLFGALSLAELSASYPGTGGLYVYLRQAYGRPVGFLYGWSLLTMIQSGSIATLAVAFALYLSYVFPMSTVWQKTVAILCIGILSAINCLGIKSGKLTQNIVTICKLGGLGAMIALLVARGHWQVLRSSIHPAGSAFSVAAFGAALVAVLWAYEGWHVVSFTAGEFKAPQRDLPRSLFWGTLCLAAIYLLANAAYYGVLTGAELQRSDRAAATAMQAAYGIGTTLFISLLIATSILGATNGMIVTGPRVYYAMARDRLFFPQFARISTRYHSPVPAILLQFVWASLLTLLGTFQELFTYVIFTAWIFYGVTVAAVMVLRIRKPDLDRPFRVPGYPWLPLSFVLAACGITISAIIASPIHALWGIGLILLGIPAYKLFCFSMPEAAMTSLTNQST